jgi:choloylglycine hydrolase
MDKPFKEDLPNPQLHWIVSDGNECITVEFVKEGMMVYENEVGVLTNNPIFPYHLWNLSNYSCIRNNDPTNNSQKPEYYSRGRGSWGIPGDYSSGSRFVRASFVKMNSPIYLENLHSVNQCFHILDAASHHEGTVMVGDEYEITQYTSVCDAQKGIYYIRTYRNSQINAVDLFEHNLNSLQLSLYKIPWEQNVNYLKP